MDEQPKKKPLSEIGHLFLSSVRDQHLGGTPRPQRVPPGGARRPSAGADGGGASDLGVDLTPEEFARMSGITAAAAAAANEPAEVASPAARRTPPVSAVLGEHLNGKQLARVKDYARHLTATGRPGWARRARRVGVPAHVLRAG
jgi:hypothetical protein